jgi:hypothetical protein
MPQRSEIRHDVARSSTNALRMTSAITRQSCPFGQVIDEQKNKVQGFS